MKRPNFFIVGAPKCGTTSLAAWLSEHPNIFMSAVKEPHYFNQDEMALTDTLEEYEAFFRDAGEQHLAVGEASTHYLHSRVAVPGILRYNPDARLIVCIRNPIDMALSLHAENVWQGEETVRDFEEAWRLEGLRKQGMHIPATVRKNPEKLQYGVYCSLGAQVQRLLSCAPREQALLLVLDDIARDPLREYQKTLRFLGLDPDSHKPHFTVHNRRKGARSTFVSYTVRRLSQIRRNMGFRKPVNLYEMIQFSLNWAEPEEYDLSPALRSELKAYFEDDIHLLERLLDRDFTNWLEAPSSRVLRVPESPTKIVRPNFFIIGAPKSGTTALSEYLRQHPNVFFSDPKEPEYYASDFDGRVIEKEKDYTRLFAHADPVRHLAVGEGSIVYIYSSAAVPNIMQELPDAKFIIMLRNPADLVISLHAQFLMQGNENLPGFMDAWNAEPDRRHGKRIPSGCRDPKWLYYSDWGRLGSQLKRVRDIVPDSKLKVILFDDFTRHTPTVYREVLNFLCIPDDKRTVFPRVNERRLPRSIPFQTVIGTAMRLWLPFRTMITGGKGFGVGDSLSRWNTLPAQSSPLPEAREMLTDFYKDEVRMLEDLLGRDLSAWRTESPG